MKADHHGNGQSGNGVGVRPLPDDADQRADQSDDRRDGVGAVVPGVRNDDGAVDLLAHDVRVPVQALLHHDRRGSRHGGVPLQLALVRVLQLVDALDADEPGGQAAAWQRQPRCPASSTLPWP